MNWVLIVWIASLVGVALAVMVAPVEREPQDIDWGG